MVSATDCSVDGSGSLPTRDTDCRLSVQCKVFELPSFYDAITGPTEFISLVNSVKWLICPRHHYPTLKEGNSLCILLSLSVLSNRGLEIRAKKCIYMKGVIVPMALYGAEAWGMRSAQKRKVNVLEVKCLRSLVGVSRMDRVRNEEVCRRAGIKRELASSADQRVLRWFGHVERIDEYRMARRVLMADVSGGRVRGRSRLGWMDGVKVALCTRG